MLKKKIITNFIVSIVITLLVGIILTNIPLVSLQVKNHEPDLWESVGNSMYIDVSEKMSLREYMKKDVFFVELPSGDIVEINKSKTEQYDVEEVLKTMVAVFIAACVISLLIELWYVHIGGNALDKKLVYLKIPTYFTILSAIVICVMPMIYLVLHNKFFEISNSLVSLNLENISIFMAIFISAALLPMLISFSSIQKMAGKICTEEQQYIEATQPVSFALVFPLIIDAFLVISLL